MEKEIKEKISNWKKIKFIIFITTVSIFIFLILAEIYLSLFNPQPYLYPRLSYSEKYRKIPPKNYTIVHSNPPHKRYYSVNEYNLRGKLIPISNEYDKPNIVILGDSYTFGIGVNDGDEYASILADNVKSNYNIINTACSGWGLTQQIRRFYELGQLYDPEIVFLLFCGNDPDDNLKDNCTKIKDDKFLFSNFDKDNNLTVYRMNKLLSKSIIQKSNLYMVLSQMVWPFIKGKQMNKSVQNNTENTDKTNNKIPLNEKMYNELLNLFAKDLHNRGIKFYFASVNYYDNNKKEYQLDGFPNIKENVFELEKSGLIDYLDINKWFKKEDMVASPVGHYDKGWNSVMGDNLAKIFTVNNDTIRKNNN